MIDILLMQLVVILAAFFFVQLANGDSKKKAPTIPEGTAEATKNTTNYEHS